MSLEAFGDEGIVGDSDVCEVCQRREATLDVSMTVLGETKMLNLCDSCGAPFLRAAEDAAAVSGVVLELGDVRPIHRDEED